MCIEKLIKDAEKADSVASLMQDVNPHAVLELHDKLKAAEAQLAELAKQEPFAYWKPDHFGPVFRQGKGYALTDKRYKPLFEQPVPPAPVKLPGELTTDGIISMHECGVVEGWNACRAEVLLLNGAGIGQ